VVVDEGYEVFANPYSWFEEVKDYACVSFQTLVLVMSKGS